VRRAARRDRRFAGVRVVCAGFAVCFAFRFGPDFDRRLAAAGGGATVSGGTTPRGDVAWTCSS